MVCFNEKISQSILPPVAPGSCRRFLLTLVALTISPLLMAQEGDTTRQEVYIKGEFSVTNNGISLIPSFSLGKPATVVDLKAGGKRYEFNPQLRFDLEGFKPWSFGFISRYKFILKNRWFMSVGTHFPGLVFNTQSVVKNGVTMNETTVMRFLPFEYYAGFAVNEKVQFGLFAMYGLGLNKNDPNQPKKNTFISAQARIDQVRLYKKLFLLFNPQVYYLRMDNSDGFFASTSLTLARQNTPFSITTLFNKVITSEIAVKGFDWNVSLVYSFKNELYKK